MPGEGGTPVMPEKGLAPHAAAGAAGGVDKHPIKEAVCVHTQKIYDACRERQNTRYIFMMKYI